jgi:heme-degrading monooxygenase HmoA
MKQVNRIVMLAVVATSVALAQAPATPAPTTTPPRLVGSIAAHPDWPKAKPEDVQSPEAILNAVYSAISGAKGQPRDWDRMRSLIIPDARLIPSMALPAAADAPAHADAIVLTIDGYIARSSARMTSDGFFEHSIHNETEQFGNIVQVWSTYESRHNADDPTPFARGINSFQLLKDGDRYWVVNIFWDSESSTKPIPAKYLP